MNQKREKSVKIQIVEVPVINLNKKNYVFVEEILPQLSSNEEIKLILGKEKLSQFYNCKQEEIKFKAEILSFAKEKKILKEKIKDFMLEKSDDFNTKKVKKMLKKLKKNSNQNFSFLSYLLKLKKIFVRDLIKIFPETNINNSKTNTKKLENNVNNLENNVKNRKPSTFKKDFKSNLFSFFSKKFVSKIMNSKKQKVGIEIFDFENKEKKERKEKYPKEKKEIKESYIHSFFILYLLLILTKLYYKLERNVNTSCVAIVPIAAQHTHTHARIKKGKSKLEKKWDKMGDSCFVVSPESWKAKHIFQYYAIKSKEAYGENTFEFSSIKGNQSRGKTYGKIKRKLIIPFEENDFVDKGEIKSYIDWVFEKESRRVKFKINLNFILSSVTMDNWLQKRERGQILTEKDELDSGLWK